MADDTPRASEAYKDIRSLARGIALLKCMNQMPGGTATTTELGQMTQVHRTTVKRMLETLRTCGLVRPTEQEGQYCLTFEVKRLSEGFIEDEWISQVATPLMRGAVKQLMWPCDLATMEAGFLVVRESTHRFSLLSQHQAMIGERLPLFVTAIGRAYLAACDAEQLGSILQLLAGIDVTLLDQRGFQVAGQLVFQAGEARHFRRLHTQQLDQVIA
ncbi:MAG: helix-turn-helix domain-containing protein, partial [Comamonas sp.]